MVLRSLDRGHHAHVELRSLVGKSWHFGASLEGGSCARPHKELAGTGMALECRDLGDQRTTQDIEKLVVGVTHYQALHVALGGGDL